MRLLLFNILFFYLSVGCATRGHVASEYKEVATKSPPATPHRTVLFILVDGLSLQLITSEINKGHLPNIQKFFIGAKGQFNVARVVFPSATSPSIASLLTERPVDQNGISGNLIFKDGHEINFQSPEKFDELNRLIKGQNIFSRLNEKKLRTVSLDYLFTRDSTVHAKFKDIKVAKAYLEKNYAYIDGKLIDSLTYLLTENHREVWPDFIFLHLVGIDLMSHDRGPQSTAVVSYLQELDKKMGNAFRILDSSVVVLSSDHGFDDQVRKVIKLENIVRRLDHRIIFLNEGRFAALHFARPWPSRYRSSLMLGIAAHPDIDIVAYRADDKIIIHSGRQDATVSLVYDGDCLGSQFKIEVSPSNLTGAVCPDNLDEQTNNLYYPYFINNISHYFQGESHPDAVVIPKPGVALHNKYVGQHGGPTPQEIFVPLMFHNASLSHPKRIPALNELLRFL